MGEVSLEEAVHNKNQKADLLNRMTSLKDEAAFGEPSCASSLDIEEM